MGGVIGGLMMALGLMFIMQAGAALPSLVAVIGLLMGTVLTSCGVTAFVLWLTGEFL